MTPTRDHRSRPDLFADADLQDGPGANGARARRPPKGYTRTDEHVRGDICEALAQLTLDWSELEVLVSKGEVTLRGLVGDAAMKREAQRVARRTSGVHEVVDQVRVVGEPKR